MNNINQKDIPYGSLLVPIGNSIEIFNEFELKEAYQNRINNKKVSFFNRIKNKFMPGFIKIKNQNTIMFESQNSITNNYNPVQKKDIWKINGDINDDFFQIPEIQNNPENITYH